MQEQKKISAVVLAGGQSKRMQTNDKGLQLLLGKPLVCFSLKSVTEITDDIFLSANRNQAQYQQFGFPVVADENDRFDGPLAGVLAVMKRSVREVLLVIPCDLPLLTAEHLRRLLHGVTAETEIAVAYDGNRLHPTVMAVRISLAADLDAYLHGGARKLQDWIVRHRWRKVDFADCAASFRNINSLEELAQLEIELSESGKVPG
ncbi:molybdenum cofactor guanylyltransferase MobA [Methylomonas rhizoryzae]|uniref:molybdenum cofactor guanylyltransferase MobA n=1 Tax=Methylomonas rhizoryzae TaxID=2608981 RepID=UPI001231B510|nr:molybdenum cofactor guanylyltransferase MobA [Methylomonas rhizoryzae]